MSKNTTPEQENTGLWSNDFSPEKIHQVIQSGVSWLNQNQEEPGYWVGMLESNSCMEAEWVLAQHFLGITDDPKYAGVIQSILNEQREDGSWEVYYEATAGDINATVECYAALKISGLDPESEPLKKALQWIHKNGGLTDIRVFTKYWLALIGEWPWEATPQLPPEVIFLPHWFPLSIYRFSSWARGTLMPLCILSARRPTQPLPPEKKLDELFPQGRDKFDYKIHCKGGFFSWERFFITVDRALNLYLKSPIKPLREKAIQICLQWIIKHQEADGAWSGIQPPWIYSLMALNIEGYAFDHPVVASGLSAFDKHWSYERNGATYLQASESPVWDTLLSTFALLDCQETYKSSPNIAKALNWILQEQVTAPGDWQIYVKGVKSGGWAFERANDCYPDTDDTGVALIVLSKLRSQVEDPSSIDKAIELGAQWLFGMQSSNGGWGAFDKDNNSKLVTKIPFCDFGEALDPPSVDVTAHILEAFGLLGYKATHPVIAKALNYIKSEQEEDGAWFGRWGVNYIYGTASVLPALKELKEDMSQPYICKAADWIVNHQNEDGGWGETCKSYMDDSLRGVGESTASQSAWALMALLATGSHDYDQSITKGLRWLTQKHKEGTWDEPQYTGTGFPGYGVGERVYLKKVSDKLQQGTELSRAFMINYNYYRHYFPLMALGRACKHFGITSPLEKEEKVSLVVAEQTV